MVTNDKKRKSIKYFSNDISKKISINSIILLEHMIKPIKRNLKSYWDQLIERMKKLSISNEFGKLNYQRILINNVYVSCIFFKVPLIRLKVRKIT